MNRISHDGLLLFICFIISCSQNQKIPDNIILAEIGDKVITIQDFIREQSIQFVHHIAAREIIYIKRLF